MPWGVARHQNPAPTIVRPLTWSQDFINSNVILSNNNLTVTTGPTVSSNSGGRANVDVVIRSGQKMIFEMNDIAFSGQSNQRAIGVCNVSCTFGAGSAIGFDANLSCGGFGSAGIFVNSAGTLNFTNFGTGDKVDIAVDRVNNKIWFRTNGGNWNNDVIGNQDPANNIGGQDISGIVGDLYPAYTLWNAAGTVDSFTLNPTNALSFTPPVGFSTFS
jgi:hypothetical protein